MREMYRPEIHLTAENGVLRAPAGVLRDGTTWHMFYQYQPTPEAGSRWGHSTSEDAPFHWDACDDVLAPQGAETDVRAGTALSRSGGATLVFTSVTPEGTNIQKAEAISLSGLEELSNDPLALDPAVERCGVLIDSIGGYSSLRSPCVVPDWESDSDREQGHAGWLMLAVAGPSEDPTVLVLGKDSADDPYELYGPLTFDGDPGLRGHRHLVSPRILRLRDEVDGDIYDILLVTVEADGIDHSGYIVGRLDGATFHVTTGMRRIDYGHDFTRPRNTTAAPDSLNEATRYECAILFGLLNGVGRLDDPTVHRSLAEEGWANALSLPRTVTLQGGLLYQTPMSGITDAIASSAHARSWVGLCDIPAGSKLTVDITDEFGNVGARVTHSGDELTVDRSMNPHHEGDKSAVAKLREDDSDSLSIFVDGSTLEVFADGGQVAMASRIYFDMRDPKFVVHAEGGAKLHRAHESDLV